MKILILDDELPDLTQLADRFLEAGFTVIRLQNPAEIADTIAREQPDLIIMDWDLGAKSSKTGEQVFEDTLTNGIPILKISNYTDRSTCLEDNQLAEGCGHDYRQVDKLYGADRMIEIVHTRLTNGHWPVTLVDAAHWV